MYTHQHERVALGSTIPYARVDTTQCRRLPAQEDQRPFSKSCLMKSSTTGKSLRSTNGATPWYTPQRLALGRSPLGSPQEPLPPP